MSVPAFLNNLGLKNLAAWLRRPTMQIGVSDFKRQVAQMVDNAGNRTVVIEKHGRPQAVLISFEAYQNLRETLAPSLETLAENFDTALAHLQGSTGQEGLEAAFHTRPGEAGQRELKKRFGAKR